MTNLPRRRAAVHPRIILLWAVIFILVNIGLYSIAPWILPVRVIEGPFVQQATETSAIIVCYTTRAAALTLQVEGGKANPLPQTEPTRHAFKLEGLQPGNRYPYRILAGDRLLTKDELRANRAANQSFRFIVFGDSGRGTREQYALAGDIARADPHMILHTGDLVYPSGDRSDYNERFFAPYRNLIGKIPFWTSLGNHDVGKPSFGEPYRSVFELPLNGPAGVQAENNYWFDYGPARFIIFDSNVDQETLATKIAPWIFATFASAPPDRARWRFVCFHHPPYTAGKYAPGDGRIRAAIVPVLDAAGVDMVFNGHDHMYARTHPLRAGEIVKAGEGPVYIISGAGGAQLYEAQPESQRPPLLAILNNGIHSFTQVDVEGDVLNIRQIALGGKLLDEFHVSKSPTTAPSATTQISTPSSQPASAPSP